MMAVDVEHRVRTSCLSFSEMSERLSHGEPTFFVAKQFAALLMNGHHDLEFVYLVCAAPLGAREHLMAIAPD